MICRPPILTSSPRSFTLNARLNWRYHRSNTKSSTARRLIHKHNLTFAFLVETDTLLNIICTCDGQNSWNDHGYSQQTRPCYARVHDDSSTADYIYLMGVNLSDQINQNYSCIRKALKWCQKLLFYLSNLIIVNAYLSYRKFAPAPVKLRQPPLQACSVQSTVWWSSKSRSKGGTQENKPSHLTERNFPAQVWKEQRPARDYTSCNPSIRMQNDAKENNILVPWYKKNIYIYTRLFSYIIYKRELWGLPGSTGDNDDTTTSRFFITDQWRI